MEWFAENFSEWWLRIKNDVLLTTSIQKLFSVGTNLKGLFSKISPRIHQSYKKERRYSKHSFMHGEHGFLSSSFEQFETVWLDKQHLSDCSLFLVIIFGWSSEATHFGLWRFFVYFFLIHAIDSLSFKCYRKLNNGG